MPIIMAQLTLICVSPAFDRVVVQQGTCVIETCGDLFGCAPCAQVNRVGIGLLAVFGVAIAEFTMEITSPALDSSVVQQCTCVIGPSGNLPGGAAATQINGFGIGLIALDFISIAKLSTTVVSPAFDSVVVQEHTSVWPPVGDLFDRAAASQVNGFDIGFAAACGVAISKLTVCVVSPALHRIVIQYSGGLYANHYGPADPDMRLPSI